MNRVKYFRIAISRIVFVWCMMMFSGIPAKATHIVGGVMNYRYLGNDSFEISLYVYRDCKRGIPPLDPDALIWVWNHDIPDFFMTLFTPIPFDSTLDATIKDPCALIQPDECVDWTHYKEVIDLPPNNTGYTVYYQRCCRNNSILNITRNPVTGEIEWGATYSIFIPPSVNGEHINNSSPVFNNYPPVYICVGKPITYNHSATDADGDRLVYHLCTPFTGASTVDPTNYFTDEPPPFDTVEWQSPYNLDNVLGGVPLSIDSVTGVMSGTPNTVGQFVVGVCVDEYRGNKWLTRTTRDFQFNVVNCGLQVVSSFFAPDLQCNSLTVNFQNQSTGADRFYWTFGDGDTSTLLNPSHTYRDTGYYTVSLLSIKGDTCTSTYSKTISVQYKRINADFMVSDTACIKPGDLIYFTDKSTDSLSVASWDWQFSNGQNSTLQNPSIPYSPFLTTISATLTVTSVNGCTSTITKTIRLLPQPSYNLDPILTKCTIQNSQINLAMGGNNTFTWSPSTDLDDPHLQNPTTSTQTNRIYYVTIKSVLANGDTCVQFDSVQVKILNTLQINATDTVKVCDDSVRLSIPISPGQTVIWSTSNTFIPVIDTTPDIVIAQSVPSKKYYVKVDAGGCQAIDSVLVLYSDTIPQINLVDNILQCDGQVSLNVQIDYSDYTIWSTSSSMTPVIATGNSYQTTQSVKTVTYYVSASYHTCTSIDSVVVTVQDTLPVITLDDTMDVCNNQVNIFASVRNFSSIQWSTSPDFNPVIGTSRGITIIQTVPTQKYYIKAFYRDCWRTDSIVVNYHDTIPTIDISSLQASCSHEVFLSAMVNNAQSVVWSDNLSFIPVLSVNDTLTVHQSVPLKTYYIKAKYGFCETIDSVQISISSDLPEITLSDSLFVCADSVRIIGLVTNYDDVAWAYDPLFSNIFSNTADIVISQASPEQTYYVRASKGQCMAYDSVTVLKSDTLPQVQINREPVRFCSDSVYAEAEAANYTDIIWSGNPDFTDTLSVGLNFSHIQQEAQHTYYVKALYRFCEAMDTVTLFNDGVDYDKENVSVCAGVQATISIGAQSTSDYTINWTLEDTSLTTSNTSGIQFTPLNSQWVKFTIVSASGCTVMDSLFVNVHPLPLVDATADPDSIYLGQTVQLLATQNQQYTYNWIPADQVSDPSLYNPTASPTENTLFQITVTDRNGCSDADSVLIRVIKYTCNAGMVFIPNSFTPNGDGVNDVFRVRSEILASFKLMVYNRWGEKVFESSETTPGWDGTYKGHPLPADVYGYYFEGHCAQGEMITLKGNVTLLN